MTKKAMLTRAEVTRLLGISRTRVRQLEERLLHPTQDENGVHQFDRVEIERFLATREQKRKEVSSHLVAMLRANMPVLEIIVATGLSEDEVLRLYKQLRTPIDAAYREKLEEDEQRALEKRESELQRWELARRRSRKTG